MSGFWLSHAPRKPAWIKLLATVAALAIPRGSGAQESKEPVVDPPHWALGISGGAAARRGRGESEKDDTNTYGALGGTMLLRDVHGPFGLYGGGTALPLWAKHYSARAGFILGAPYTPHAGFPVGEHEWQTEPYRAHAVAGLLAGGGVMAGPEGFRPHAELGFGIIGPFNVDVSTLFEPVHDSWGARVAFHFFGGRGAVGAFCGLQMQGIFVHASDHPAPAMVTFDLGVAQGFDVPGL